MRKDLKQELDLIEVPRSEVFRGAGWVAVTVNKTLGKALGLEKDAYYGYIYWSKSDNGNFPFLEDKVNEIVNAHNKAFDGNAKIHIRLT